MPNTELNGTPAVADAGLEYEGALSSLRPRLMAMPDDALQWQVSLDASTAADVVEAASVRLMPHREALAAQFGESAAAIVDELRVIARATKQAHIELARSVVSMDASPLRKEVSAAYQLLMTDAQSLANRGVLDRQKLEGARDIQGYQALLQSVLVLVSVLREAWPAIAEHTPLTVADLDNAARAARKMTTALAERDFGSTRTPELELRTRALSLLVDSYEEVRRMMSFLRWKQDDADTIVPSLWAARSRRSRGGSRGDSPVVNDDRSSPSPIVPGGDVADPSGPGGPFAPTPA